LLLAVPLLGCPHAIFAIPTLMTRTPSFPASAAAEAGSQLVPVALDFETGGHFLLFRARVDGTNLEPSAGSCRRWFMRRVAREAGSAQRTFCSDDDVGFDVGAGARHSLEVLLSSEHTVAERVMLRPGENVRWRLPIRSGPIEIPLDVEPGHSYTVEGREVGLDLRRALAKDAPSGTRWDLDGHEPVFTSGVQVGSLRIRVLRDADGQVVEELSAPLVSGRSSCGPPFCP
jgi:hypothetical protein